MNCYRIKQTSFGMWKIQKQIWGPLWQTINTTFQPHLWLDVVRGREHEQHELELIEDKWRRGPQEVYAHWKSTRKDDRPDPDAELIIDIVR